MLLPIKQAVPTLYVKHVLLPIKQAVPTLYVKLLKATTRERKFMSNSLCSNDINYIYSSNLTSGASKDRRVYLVARERIFRL